MDSVSFLREAQNEFDESLAWYLERSESAADGFEEAVERAVQEIVEHPERWAFIDDRHRYRMLRRYPYLIVYRVDADMVIVVAIAHSKRRPEYWANRE